MTATDTAAWLRPKAHVGARSTGERRKRCRAYIPDADLSHCKRFARYVDLPVVDPLRMLAVAVLSLAADDARHGLHVELGAEWVYALEEPHAWVTELGVEILDDAA